MPISINLAPEICQKQMSDFVTGLPNVDAIIDDILVHDEDMYGQDKHLQAVLEKK